MGSSAEAGNRKQEVNRTDLLKSQIQSPSLIVDENYREVETTLLWGGGVVLRLF